MENCTDYIPLETRMNSKIVCVADASRSNILSFIYLKFHSENYNV